MGRLKSYRDADAVCPFYTGSAGAEIGCAGTCEGMMHMQLLFADAAQMRGYREDFCDSLRTYENCPLYAAHED